MLTALADLFQTNIFLGAFFFGELVFGRWAIDATGAGGGRGVEIACEGER